MVSVRKRKQVTYNDSDSDFMSDEEVRSQPTSSSQPEKAQPVKTSKTKAGPKKKVALKQEKEIKTKKKAKTKEDSDFESQEEEKVVKTDKKKAKAQEEEEEEEEDSGSDTEVIYSKSSTKKSTLVIQHPKGSPFPDAISPLTMEFLAGLAENNDREYMHLHSKEWVAVKKDFIDFCGLVMSELHQIDPTVLVEEPKHAMYRQNRDLRFSNDKRPYKNYLSASFSPEGRKFVRAGYFLSIEPNNKTMIAAGIWLPNKEMLQSLRDNIIRNGDLIKEALATDAIKDIFDGKFGKDILEASDKLKVAPKGISKDHPEIELLRFKSFAVSKRFTDQEHWFRL
ncbi:hypothetical protein INT48_006265 [Thamnidium elegans]|uniref:Uncharacterized protein n=1 Tax=Thamnidium elegans TaxID=101142 RepID=A0A8H7SJ94_9FUNG|nr:hypothetical protein INT48_006265 [Thamnidium elegans]